MLGPSARRLIYVHMFADKQLALEVNNAGVPAWEDRAIRYGWPVVERIVHSVLGIRPGVEVEDEAAVWRELDFAAALLADGRPYLNGERFGAADLTFAALSAAVLLPPGYGVRLPQPEELRVETAELVRRARAHRAGQYALSLFDRHRHAFAGSNLVHDDQPAF